MLGPLGIVEDFGTSSGKTVNCSELNKLFCGSLEDKNVERNAGGGCMACEVSEGSKNYYGCVRLRMYVNETFALLGQWMLVNWD